MVGVFSGDQIRQDNHGKVLWAWKGEEGPKTVVQLDHPLLSLHYIGTYRAEVLCAHTNGQLSILDASLQTRPVTLPAYPAHEVIAANVTSVSGQTVRAVLLDKKGKVFVVELDVGGPREVSGQVIKKGELLDRSKSGDISDAMISSNGAIAAMTSGKSRSIVSRTISDLSGDAKPFPPLRHNNTAAPLPLNVPGHPLALLAVNDPNPTILLVSTSPSLPAVLLSSSLATLAPTASSAITNLSVLDHPIPGRFVIGVTLTYSSEEGGRTVVYTLELAVPEKGVGMSALIGTYADTAAYFSVPSRGTKAPSFDTFIDDLTTGIQDGKGYSVFENWFSQEQEAFKPQGKVPASFTLPEYQTKAILRTVFDAALRKVNAEEGGDEGQIRLEPTGRYEPKIIETLISRKFLHDEMYAPGVLSTLLALNDWANASKATRLISSIPSSSLVTMLSKSIHPPIDSEESTSAPSAVLRDILAHPVPAPDYRLALRSGLSVEDATVVLEVLGEWMGYFVSNSSEILKGWAEDKKSKKQKEAEKEKEESSPIPQLEGIINHASVLLDSHLPLFLTYAPSHAALEALQTNLAPLLALQDNYRKLRAPVEAALTLSKREQRKADEAKAKRDRVQANTNAGAGAGAAKANGQRAGASLPDEAVGKWRVEQFAF